MSPSNCFLKGWLHLSLPTYLKCSCCFIICLLTWKANGQSSRISIHVRHKPITHILGLITQKTGTAFFYNIEEIKKLPPVSLQADNETIDQILQQLLKDQALRIVHTNGIIAILPANSNENAASATTVTGRISDVNGIPLPQATITEKGSTNCTKSDTAGIFHLSVKPSAVLQVTYLGMQMKLVPVKSTMFLSISLQPALTFMNEVVINGYSNIKQKYSAASVTNIMPGSLDRNDQLSVDNMLQGKVPGLTIMTNSTNPGAAPKIRLRGTATLLGNREPLWVIDGIISNPPVKLDAAGINSLDEVNLMTSPIIGLNPKDIKQIDVLKDAAATALYGVNSGNGVILITTRDGVLEKAPAITFSQMTNITFRPGYRQYHQMNASQRIALSKEIIDAKLPFSNGILPQGFERDYTDFLNGKMNSATFEELERGYESMNTDWFNILFNNGVTQNYHLSVNGGGRKTTYYSSVGYATQQGPAIFTQAKQYSLMLGLTWRPVPGLQTGIRLSGSRHSGAYPYQTNPYQYAYSTSRSLPYTIGQQRMNYSFSAFAPDWSLPNYVMDTSQVARSNIITDMENSHTNTSVNTYKTVIHADWTLLRSFTLHGLYGLGMSGSGNSSYAGEETDYIANKYRLGLGPNMSYSDAAKQNIILPAGGEYRETNTRQRDYTIRHAIEYNFATHSHYLQLLAGNELRQSKYDIHKLFILGYYPDSGKVAHPPSAKEYPLYSSFFPYSNILPAEEIINKYRQMSWYGMLVYSYKDRYTLNFNIRQDGANYFAQYGNKTWQRTWSAAAKWSVLDEPRIKKKHPADNLLALRVSYGYNIGLPEIKSSSLSISNTSTNAISADPQATVTNFSNPGLRWEKTYVFNAGVDFSFFNNRLYGTVEAYNKRSTNLLASIDLAEENGFNSALYNSAGVENSGMEAGIQWQVIRQRDWKWTVGTNLSFNKTRVLQTNLTDPGMIGNQQQYLDGNIIKSGTDPNTMYAYKFTGLNTNGFPTFRGIYDRDYAVQPTVAEYYAHVFVPVGSRMPSIDGCFSTNLRYRNWHLSAVFQVKLGYKQRLINLYGIEGFIPNPADNASTIIAQRWKQPGDEKTTNIPRLGNQSGAYFVDPITMSPVQYYRFSAATMQSFSGTVPLYLMSTLPSEMYNNSDIRTVNASHVRLSTLSLQYTINAGKAGKHPFKNISCYTQVHDMLLLASKSLNGQDPELPPGTMPRRPSLTLGMDVNF
jgi:TonB-linked SusC/RagA family outer membrane protein